MAVQIRTNKKATKVFYKLMGKPAFMEARKTKKEKAIDHMLTVQGFMNTLYK